MSQVHAAVVYHDDRMVSVENLPVELWLDILRFLNLQQVLFTSMNVLVLSKHVYSTLVALLETNENGLFKFFCEVLHRDRIVNIIDRVMDRKLFMYTVGDFNEQRHCYDLEQIELKKNAGVAADLGRTDLMTRSRLNAEPCGRSMAKMRRELKKLTEFCYANFPVMYQERKELINKALERSIKGCTELEKETSDLVKYTDNTKKKPNKPKIWGKERREQSIKMCLERDGSKQRKVHWKTLWKYRFHEHLLDELQYYRSNLKSHLLMIKYPTRVYGRLKIITLNSLLDSMENILVVLSMLGEDFYSEFRDQNFYLGKKHRSPIDFTVKMNFLQSLVVTITQFFKYQQFSMSKENIGEDCFNRAVKMLDYCMNTHEKTLTEIFPGTSIYNYIIKLNNNDLVERYFTPRVIEIIKENTLFHNQFMASCLNHLDDPSEMIMNLVKSFNLAPSFLTNNLETSFAKLLVTGYGIYNEEFNTRKWTRFLIELFGKKEVTERILEGLQDNILQGLPENQQVTLKDLFGDELREKLKQVEGTLIDLEWNE